MIKQTISFSFLILILQVDSGTSFADAILFSCPFTKNTCGMENQEGARAHWQREYLMKGDRVGYAMVTRGNEASNHFARILTPFLPTHGAKTGCLKFLHFIEGRTPASLAVIKQGYVTQYLFASARKTENSWEKVEIDVDFLGDKILFYFESDTRTQDYGSSLVAFTDLIITSKPCSHRHFA